MQAPELPEAIEVNTDEDEVSFHIPADTDEAMELYLKQPIAHELTEVVLRAHLRARQEPPEIRPYMVRGFLSEHAGETLTESRERLGLIDA